MMDTDHDDVIAYSEFLAAALQVAKHKHGVWAVDIGATSKDYVGFITEIHLLTSTI